MEKPTNGMEHELKSLSAVVIEKTDGGPKEVQIADGSTLFSYDGYLAVLKDDGSPWGKVDEIILENFPQLDAFRDDGRESADIISERIRIVSERGNTSLAVSMDNLGEIADAVPQVTQTFTNSNLLKIGFFYPKP